MTDDNSNLVDIDLDTFEAEFFQREPVATEEQEETVEDEEVIENEDDTLATDEDTDASEDETEEDETEEEEEEDKPAPKPKKKSFQDRIDELTRDKRETERLAAKEKADLLARIEALEARKTEDTKPEPKPLREQLPTGAPDPDAEDENGEPVYPLGEFDKQYIRDLTKFTIAEEKRIADEEDAKAAQAQLVEAAQEELKSSWLEKVEAASEELPDLREKLEDMGKAFDGVDPDYGEFLAATIMSCDNGPQMMYYLSQHIDEARKIVASGPASATLALGRLDARFAKAPVSEEKPKKKVSDAPKPPASLRGSGRSHAVNPDTDDLDAFEKAFFAK